jgi:hypothetical protein
MAYTVALKRVNAGLNLVALQVNNVEKELIDDIQERWQGGRAKPKPKPKSKAKKSKI